MSNEIKNRQHAIALIAPVPAAPFTTAIVEQVGVASFTRNSVGNYTVVLVDAAPFHVTRTSASLGANVLGIIGAQLVPGGGSIVVTAFNGQGVPFDPQFFDLAVDVIRDGEGIGPSPAVPAAPTPPGHGSFNGWAKINGPDGVITSQSASAPLDTCIFDGGANYAYTLKAGVDNQTLHVQAQGSSRIGSTSVTPASQLASATFRNDQGTLAAATHSVFFYGF